MREWRVTSAGAITLALALCAVLPATASAHDSGSPAEAGAAANWTPTGAPATRATTRAAPAACPTPAADADPISPDIAINGEFGSELRGSYVMVPFTVPAGTTAVRVKYCYDQPDAQVPGLPTNVNNTLDLGLYDARPTGASLWGEGQFRGWGGSSHPDVTVAPNGFSPEADYVASPKLNRRGYTTRGFEPGAIPAGNWAVELGVASVATQAEGNTDGKVAWRVEVDLINATDYADRPYQPAPYDPGPARSEPGWYAGDLHVHSEHSALGDATMNEVFDYAFKPLAAGGAGLDFITLSDYVTDSAWGEIGRYQAGHPSNLIERSSEVITYRGHTNNHGSATFVDYRTGPIYERDAGGALTPLRGSEPASRIFDEVHANGGWTQINHPTIFPSAVPSFASLCRGCPWDYSAAETDYSKVDAIEVATGPAGAPLSPLDPGPNPFTATAVQFYEDALATGAHIAAVGVSDSHKAGRTGTGTTDPLTQAPIGTATTVLFAEQLSEQGIEEAVKAGHTYVKVAGNDGPDLRFEAVAPGRAYPAIMGDTVKSSSADFSVRVTGAGPSAPRLGPYVLLVVKDGMPLLSYPILSDDATFSFPSLFGPGRYRLQLMRLGGVAAIEGVSSPIYLDPNASDSPPPPPGSGVGPGGGGNGAGGAGGSATARPDAVDAKSCTTVTSGTRRADRLMGGDSSDLIAGLGRGDRISGRAGADCLYGNAGRDRVAGGPGADMIFGGPGSDRIDARDGEADLVLCGGGRDRALLDAQDTRKGCERTGSARRRLASGP